MNAPLFLIENPDIREKSGSVAHKEKLVHSLKRVLRKSFERRWEGGDHARKAHQQGYADGFMSCLIESGALSEREILGIVTSVRRGESGPATADVDSSDEVEYALAGA